MFRVEVVVSDENVLSDRMSTMREWLDHQRFQPTGFRCTFGLAGAVCQVEFALEAEAIAFAQAFAGSERRAET